MFSIHTLEQVMYTVSDMLLAPTLILIALLFVYSLVALGRFSALYFLRKKGAMVYQRNLSSRVREAAQGYLIHNYFIADPEASTDEMEVYALKRLENLRVVTRVAPMLGLIATMIPMGPALKSLADGNIQGISENLMIAFSAVILALVTASITYWPASVKKRWFAAELINIEKLMKKPKQLPGPTGESNIIYLENRGNVVCFADKNTSFHFWVLSIVTALATGNTVVTVVSDLYFDEALAFRDKFIATGADKGVLQVAKLAHLEAMLAHPALAGVVVDSNCDRKHYMSEKLAQRSGAILPVITSEYFDNLIQQIHYHSTGSANLDCRCKPKSNVGLL